MKRNEVKIHDNYGTELKGAMCFEHKGYEISVSLIPKIPEIMVFKGGDCVTQTLFDGAYSFIATAENLKTIIDKIDIIEK